MTNETVLKTDVALILKALAFATAKHSDQRRKNVAASPYINHPIALANLLCNEGGIVDAEVICAALLHDTLEDTPTTVDELKSAFGDAIANLVVELSDDKTLSQAARKQLQIEHAAHLSPKAKLVKLADKICNARDVGDDPPVSWNLKRRQDFFLWAKSIVDQLRGTHEGLERAFDLVYSEMPNLARSAALPIVMAGATEMLPNLPPALDREGA